MNTCADYEAEAVNLINKVASGPSRVEEIKAQMRELIRAAYHRTEKKPAIEISRAGGK